MSIKFRLFMPLLLLMLNGIGQSPLDQYIQEALLNNQSIRQQQFNYEKSLLALQEAKSLYGPTIQFQTDYFLAGGGRTVDFPLGDILNPVYSTLNQLTSSNRFPTINNQRILLNPNNFYDAKIRTSMPILNAELAYNKRIKQEQVSLQALEVQLYKRELVKEIKLAYFQYLQSLEAIQICQSALTLVNESKRVNTALFENDKVNRTVLLRANNEVVKYEASKQQAEKQSASARAFFNFLLNRPLTDSIKVDHQFSMPVLMANNALAVTQREEWLKLKVADKINHELSGLAKSVVTPKISGFVDLGSQSFDWKFNDQSRYYFMGISLQWNLFTSGKNTIKVKQTILDNNILKAQTDNILQQLELKLSTALNDYYAAIANYTAANASLKTAQTYATDMMKLYKEGQALYIELLDAQNQLIQTKIQFSITLYNTHIKFAEIERATASFNLN